MVQTAFKLSKFNRERVIGMAGVLDSARFRTFIAEELKVSVENVTGICCSAATETPWFPCRATPQSRACLLRSCSKATVDRMVQRTRDGGAEIVKYLKAGSAYYAPFAQPPRWSRPFSKTRRKCFLAPRISQGEYGINGLCVGVLCKLGSRGLEEIIELKLNPEEQAGLQKSADAVKELCAVIGV